MSTKIYAAYKIPVSKLNDFISITTPIVYTNLSERIQQIMAAMDMSFVLEKLSVLKEPHAISAWSVSHTDPTTNDSWAKVIRFYIALNLAKKASTELERSYWDLEITLSVRLHNKYAYIIPIQAGTLLGFDNLPVWVKDYAYWDNSDGPEEISRKSWLARGKMWDKIDYNPIFEYSYISFGDFNAEFRTEKILEKLIFGDVGISGFLKANDNVKN